MDEDPKIIICLADDDEDDRMLLHEALLELDRPFRIFELCSAQQLIEHFSKPEQEPADFIFLDLYMPGMDGFECIERLRGMGLVSRNARIVVYSLDSAGKTMQKAFALGADFYAVKPSTYADLKNLVAIVMGASWEALSAQERIFHIR